MAGELRFLPPPKRSDSWAQHADESDIEYACFLKWLHQDPRSDASMISQATRFNWAARARAWDAKQSILGKPNSLMAETFHNLLQLVLIESRALLRRSLESPEGTVSLPAKDIATLVGILLEYPQILASGLATSTDYDLSKMSLEDIRKLQEAKKIISKARG